MKEADNEKQSEKNNIFITWYYNSCCITSIWI